VDTSAQGSVVDISGCTYSGDVRINHPLTLSGGTITVRSGQTGITVAADDVTLVNVHVVGPQASAFVKGEDGIAVSATASHPVHRLTIRSCEISSFGDAGVSLLDVVDVALEGNRIHDIVYAGIIILSGSGGTISHNAVQRIGVVGSSANGGNAYGITLTRYRGTIAAAPPTTNFIVSSNTIENVPTWHALDTHAGRQIAFIDNIVRQASRAVFITTDGADLRASNITISGNRLEAPTTVKVNLQAITTYASDEVVIKANTAIGWDPSQVFEDYQSASHGLVVSGNIALP
jgi:hypothetical protein